MQPYDQRMNQMKSELQNPQNFQPNELFLRSTKFALIICNEFYDKRYITLGDLPAVVDDLRNAKHTVKLMGILPENTFVMKNVSHDELSKQINQLFSKFDVLTNILKNTTGILSGLDYCMSGGLLWEILRPSAMKLMAPFNYITIDLDVQDQNQLKELIEMQEATGDN